MAIDLRTVDARLTRASDHVVALRTAVNAYAAIPPWTLHHLQGRTREREIQRTDLAVHLPASVPVILSDVIHQCRAALDNLVTALRGEPAPATGFPVRETEEEFDQVAPTALAGVPDWAVATIKLMQPFSADHRRYVGERLRELDVLAKRDRHRAPPLQVALLRPKHVFSNEGAAVEMRGDLATWAEIEYVRGRVTQVRFEVEDQFEPSVPHAGQFEIVSWSESMVRTAWAAVEQVRLEARRQA